MSGKQAARHRANIRAGAGTTLLSPMAHLSAVVTGPWISQFPICLGDRRGGNSFYRSGEVNNANCLGWFELRPPRIHTLKS